jgi:hypothetical protein
MALELEEFRISASVGRGGMNVQADVLVVQQLINNHLPIPFQPLQVDGICGTLTMGAIAEIQRRNLQMNPPDGKIDPDGATFRFLTGNSAGTTPPRAAAGVFGLDVIDAAQASQTTWKIPAAVTLAQWALESNWGRAMPTDSNNPFGIKAAEGQPFVEAETREVFNGKFRKFASLTEAFDQHGHLLATASPYAHARTLAGNPNAFAEALTGVYATDPNYGALLIKIMEEHDLYQYD